MKTNLHKSENFRELVTLFYRGENERMNEVAQLQVSKMFKL